WLLNRSEFDRADFRHGDTSAFAVVAFDTEALSVRGWANLELGAASRAVGIDAFRDKQPIGAILLPGCLAKTSGRIEGPRAHAIFGRVITKHFGRGSHVAVFTEGVFDGEEIPVLH
ncbi:MAG: hypothetical protein ACK56I_03750, partial [bacterium]